MVQRYEAVGSILNSWYRAGAQYLPWPDELIRPATDANRLNDVTDALESEWEKDWIDIGGEG